MSEKPELVYNDLQLGKEFEPFYFSVDSKTITRFLKAIQEESNPFYQSISVAEEWGYDRPLAPHSIAAVYARASYLKNYTMPGGGILAKQEFKFLRPIFVGDQIVCRAKVVDRFQKKDRKYVVIEIDTCNQNGEQVSVVRIEAIWPK
ncbi:MAG TPA: MaoC family dehydratase N-terminal domain-containing protein [Desulfatiglandales bacterium]|nr:MaoC family dehydratase N-terminal domain-containing protein [Desulfatiglandales bacterium]